MPNLLRAHKAKIVQQWCQENLAYFWPANFWVRSPPDMALLDYGIWGIVKSKACSVPHMSINALMASVEREWATMLEGHICKVCKAFRPSSRPWCWPMAAIWLK